MSRVGVVLVLVLVSCSRRTGVVLALVLISCSLVSRGYCSLAGVGLAHVLLAYLLLVLARTMICLVADGARSVLCFFAAGTHTVIRLLAVDVCSRYGRRAT